MVKKCPFIIKKGLVWNNKVCEKEIKSFIAIRKDKQFYNEYCPEHGCRICGYSQLKGQYQNPPQNFELNFGKKEKVCSLECKNEGEQEHYQKETKSETEAKQDIIKTMSNFDNETIMEIKGVFAPFYEIIKEVRMNELRKELLKEQIKIFQFQAKCGSAIEAHSSIEPTEKEQWRKTYEKVSSWKDLLNACQEERNFLVSLAKKYKNEEEQAQRNGIPECKKCKLRREQPSTWPAGCEGWCKECVEQRPAPNHNDNYESPTNNSPPTDNSPKDNQKKFPQSQNNQPANSQTDRDKQREREREREQTLLPGESSPPKNSKNAKPVVKKTDNIHLYLTGAVGVVIILAGLWFIIAFKIKKNRQGYFKLNKDKKKNNRLPKKR